MIADIKCFSAGAGPGLGQSLAQMSKLAGVRSVISIWRTIPFSALLGWMYMSLDQVGESISNPLEGGQTMCRSPRSVVRSKSNCAPRWARRNCPRRRFLAMALPHNRRLCAGYASCHRQAVNHPVIAIAGLSSKTAFRVPSPLPERLTWGVLQMTHTKSRWRCPTGSGAGSLLVSCRWCGGIPTPSAWPE
jgi:hypothetical protein